MHTTTSKPAEHSPNGPLAALHRWLFDHDFQKGYARSMDHLIAWLIIFSVVAIAAEQNPLLYAPHAQTFRLFEGVVVGVFTLEYVLRLATAPMQAEFQGKRFARLRYVLSFHALIDLIATAHS